MGKALSNFLIFKHVFSVSTLTEGAASTPNANLPRYKPGTFGLQMHHCRLAYS